jgi:hypothetical protein
MADNYLKFLCARRQSESAMGRHLIDVIERGGSVAWLADGVGRDAKLRGTDRHLVGLVSLCGASRARVSRAISAIAAGEHTS